MAKYSFLDFARDVLAESDKPLTYQEIWRVGVERGLATRVGTSGKTPWQSIGAQLYVTVRDDDASDFIKVGKRPARFFLRARAASLSPDVVAEIEKKEAQLPPTKAKYSERDLHPLLAYFAYSNPAFNRGRSIYTKTIQHEKSQKSGYGEWTHPDMVGFYIPLDDWRPDVMEFNRLSDNNSLRLFSFELKKGLNKGNYREAYFQAVSNSSWAHEAYLVAAEVAQDDELLSELERLASAFGVGIVCIDPSDIDGSAVLYPARRRETLDWPTINKLCEQNRDFAEFLEDVKIDLESKRFHKSEFDEVLPDIQSYIQSRLKISVTP